VGRGIKLGGGATVLLLLAALFLGADPGQLVGMLETPQSSVPPSTHQGGDEAADFVAAVLGDTEDTWTQLFASSGSRYRAPRLVLYEGMVQSACGMNSAAAGPFYCPGDHKVYLDLGFLRELQRLGAPGDFAFAYVIAHEIGHHVQNLAGTADRVRSLQLRSSRRNANALSVMMELQADCYAGVWAHHAHRQRNILEDGDVEEGLAAAAAVGDDRLQRMSGHGVHPESFTHGSSGQRVHWFRTGLRSGRVENCDTFAQARR
jgi:predicted metalloprotease